MSFETPRQESNPWHPELVQKAETEIMATAYNQAPTGRTDEEMSYFLSLISRMKNRELTPEEAILKARAYADSRQDGHGGGVIQD